MESSIRLCWILFIFSTTLRSTKTNVKTQDARAVSLVPAEPQETKMFADFNIQQAAFAENAIAGNLSLRIRTWQSDALVFYCFDQQRNFVQLELRSGRLLFKYNSGDAIIDFLIQRYVNDGKWHYLNIGTDLVIVDGKNIFNPHDRRSLRVSSLIGTTKLRPRENIRLLQAPKLMYGSGGVRINPVTVLVGAVLPGMGSVKAFVGCLAALQIGTFLTNLNTPAAQNPKRFVLGCDPGCSGNVCQNGGRCLERWNRKYRCYCWGNPFVGRACDKTVSTALSGSGGIVLMFPLARAVAVIGGKFGLMAAPGAWDLILHIDGTENDVALISGASQEIILLVRSRGTPAKEYRISGSLANLRPPYLVRFWLWSASDRVQLQLNDQLPLVGRWVLPQVKAKGINIGDPTLINRRLGGSQPFKHFRGCIYNFQIFMKDSDYPIELSDRPNSGQCPPFVQAIPAKKDTNVTNAGDVKDDSESMKWVWYKIVFGISGVMLVCFFIVAFIYTYHLCLKRSKKQEIQKGSYSQIAYTNATSAETPNGIKRRTHSLTTSPQHSVASTTLPGTPYKVPYRPPYVATSLVIRDGKHMAQIDSDVDLGESESELL